MKHRSLMKKAFCKSHVLYLSVIPLLSLLTACQSLRPPKLPNIPTSIITTATDSTVNTTQPIQFNITGKIGVRTSKQSGSAFYAWSQDGERSAIDLTGALGIGQTHIEGIPNHVSLQSAKTGYIEATTPEELLERATGWQAPISYLPHWINGEPVNAMSQVTRDPQHRLITLNEGGWDVNFNYNDQDNSQFPNRLVMTQSATQSSEQSNPNAPHNRVILTIQREAATEKSATETATTKQPTSETTTTSNAP
ncbi:MAG: outer membrane lipoprotein LolB [Gammaproteobacteria bacterium]|nr:outer membrane lipoprotein LolB [Gammaproteobacteria bacterium]